MDAARGVKGQGRPLYAGPWNNDGAREPAAGGPDGRGKTFWFLLGRLPKGTRRKGETVRSAHESAAYVRKPQRQQKLRGQGRAYKIELCA